MQFLVWAAVALLYASAILLAGCGGDVRCKGRARQIGAVWKSLRKAGLECRLELGSSSDECNLDVHVPEKIAKDDEVCFVPEDLYLQPYVAATWEADDAKHLAAHLWTLFSEHNVCDSRAALAVRLIHEGRKRCDCRQIRDLHDFGPSCSIWPCLLPENFSSALELNLSSQQLLNGTSAHGPMQGLRSQLENVQRCLERVTFFPADRAPTAQEVNWGFHAVRTRGSGSDKNLSRVNPVTVMFNYNPHIDSAHVFVEVDARRDAKGIVRKVKGEVMRAKFNLEPADEIFYKYGEFTNAELLVLYGFVVPSEVAQGAGAPAVRILVRDMEHDFIPAETQQTDNSTEEMRVWHSELQRRWSKLRCGDYVTMAFTHAAQIIHRHTRFFPACAALLFLSSSPRNEKYQLLDAEGQKRIVQWPPPIQNSDAEIWHELVAYQWRYLAKICDDHFKRLLQAADAAGIRRLNSSMGSKGVFVWDSQEPYPEETYPFEAILQILKDEGAVFESCKEEAKNRFVRIARSMEGRMRLHEHPVRAEL